MGLILSSMEDIEIALALLEIIAILLPLSLLIVGMGFRVLQTPEGTEILGPHGIAVFMLVAGFMLIELTLGGTILLLNIMQNIESGLLAWAPILIMLVFIDLTILGGIYLILYRLLDESAETSTDDAEIG